MIAVNDPPSKYDSASRVRIRCCVEVRGGLVLRGLLVEDAGGIPPCTLYGRLAVHYYVEVGFYLGDHCLSYSCLRENSAFAVNASFRSRSGGYEVTCYR
jgi:hypothetical protein